MDIQDLKIKGYNFSALISADELSDADVKILGAEPNELLEVHGNFTIEWDDDTPLVSIDSAHVFNGSKDVPVDDLVGPELEYMIDRSGNDSHWLADRAAALTDHYYDDER